MSDIVEIIPADPIRGDEIFCGLKFDGVQYVFQVSHENTWDDSWVYRIYHFDTIKWKLISKEEYEKIVDLLHSTEAIHNTRNFIGSEYRINQLMDIWKTHFS